MRGQIHNYLIKHKDEIVETLKELIKIPSVRQTEEENAPFGKECAEILKYTQKLYEDYGFNTELDQNGGFLLSYFGDGKKSLGLFAHADVVPAGNDWKLTSPFEPLEKDGFIIGRGAIDDKSAVVISLFCARMLKELKFPFGSRLVCFTGSSEESGMGDLKNYLTTHTPPDFSLVADTAFPLYRGNKGRILLKAIKSSPIGELKSFVGGKAGANVAEATAKLKYSPTLYEWLKTKENERIAVRSENDEIIISAVGIGKHSALPEGSINAVALIAGILSECNFLSDNTRQTTEFIFNICSDYYGNCLGIADDDNEFGKLTFVNYQISACENSTELYFNIRHGHHIGESKLKERLIFEFSKRGFNIEFLDVAEPHIVPENNAMLRALMNVYKEYTGNTEAKMRVNAGGTYAQLLPCAAEIGTSINGGNLTFELPAGHGSVHQPDECISIDGLLNAIELTMLMLLECDKQQANTHQAVRAVFLP